MAYEGYSSKYLAGWVLQSVSIPFVHVGAASVFLSLFYLTRVLARPPSDETSRGLREGQKWAIGAFVWVCLASITSMGLSISLWAPRAVGLDYFTSSYAARSLASFVFDIALYVTDLICAISVLVYIVKARKKLLGTPLQKASNNLLACGILWLIHVVWLVLFILLTNLAYYAYTGEPLGCFLIILDVLLDIYLTFVVLVLLYVLVAKDKYAVWQPQEQEQKQEQPVV
ncbi:uncharacterized protein GLRG_09696 [Colletotrichum graminicola M1.001]|uniref:Uncharacterized protein n=1 Tax=Colletotrichum graminicola (strain M1.001 / M2 / FGSC 10212) TaxID=645133 RepID=E3QUL4_COLGM|nr:uncharacterized protein GLRG_09696 [Colletotrichum graminicola M1.001]EFQ34552.1 hypothetical protein GLRG_09696 [Colletotrichum graminicola M1.001]